MHAGDDVKLRLLPYDSDEEKANRRERRWMGTKARTRKRWRKKTRTEAKRMTKRRTRTKAEERGRRGNGG